MGFLDRNLTDLTLQELGRIISRKIQTETPPLPKWLLSMDPNSPAPFVPPDPSTVNEGDALLFDEATQSFVPGTVATGSDGSPPSASSPTPTVAQAVGAIVVRWDPIVNADATGYDVHVIDEATRAGDANWLVSSTTLAARVVGTLEYIRRLPDGSADGLLLDYDTYYYVKIVAFDNDGPLISDLAAYQAAAGAESTPIQPARVTGPDVLDGTITAEKLEAVLVLGNTIKTNPGTHDGQYVQLDSADGVQVISATGEVLVNLPTDGSKANTFKGEARLSVTDILGNLTISGTTNLMNNGSGLSLGMRQADPAQAPLLTGSYPEVDFSDGGTLASKYQFCPVAPKFSSYIADNGTATKGTNVVGPATDNIPVYYGVMTLLNIVNLKYTTYAIEQGTDGTINRALALATDTTNPNECIGAVRLGSYVYAVYRRSSDGDCRCAVLNTSDFALVGSIISFGGTTTDFNPAQAGMGTNGTNPYIFTADPSSHKLSRAQVGVGTPAVPTLGAFTEFTSGYFHFDTAGHADNPGTSGEPFDVGGAFWDGSTDWYVAVSYRDASTDGGTFIRRYTQSTGAVVANTDMFMSDNGTPCAGLSAGPTGMTAFKADGEGQFFNGAVSQALSGLTWLTNLGEYLYMGYSWADATYATILSPIGVMACNSTISTAPKLRQLVNVTVPLNPTGVTLDKFYGLPATITPPASTALRRQTAATYVLSEAVADNPTTWATYNTGGTLYVAPPNDAGIAYIGGTPSYIQGATAAQGSAITAPWKLGGDGVFRLPRATVAQRLSGTIGDVMYDSDTNALTAYAGRGLWAPVLSAASRPYTYSFYDDLLTGTEDVTGGVTFGTTGNNGGVAGVAVASTALHPGVIELATGTTNNATGNAFWRFGANSIGPILLGSGVTRFGHLVKPVSAVTTPFYVLRAGIADSAFVTTDPSNGFWFRWDGNTNSNKWQIVGNGVATNTTSAAVVAGNWYLLEGVVNSGGTACEFFINGTSVGTVTQTPVGVLASHCGVCKVTSTATSRSMHLDYLYVEGEFTTHRWT